MNNITEYLVQPEYLAERKANYTKGESINKKWKAISSKDVEATCGNIGSQIHVSVKTKKISFSKEYHTPKEGFVSLFTAISSALAMYRVVCLINNPIVECEGAAGYKMPWNISLKHEETGHILMFGEWKGGFGIWTSFYKVEELPASYKKDLTEILNLLFSDASPHPYDNVTAGSVA
jgi:hypothetical protein